MILARAADDAWVIDGVFGWLANEALPRKTSAPGRIAGLGYDRFQ
jgi:hypothetical protein